MDVNLAVLADAANCGENGKLNLLGVFQTIPASTLPFQHPHMSLVLNIEASPLERGSSAAVQVRMIDEDGRAVLTLPDHVISFPGAQNVLTPNVSVIVSLSNVVFNHFGTYRFDISVNGESVARIPLHVVKVTAPQVPLPPRPA